MGRRWIKADQLTGRHIGLPIATLIDTDVPADLAVRGVLTRVSHSDTYITTVTLDSTDETAWAIDSDTPVRLLDEDEYAPEGAAR